MSTSGAKVSTEGLILAFDAQNPRTYYKRINRMTESFPLDTWKVGMTTSPTGYAMSGDGNSIQYDNAINGAPDNVWDIRDQDATSDADGGWNGSRFPIDTAFTYRYSVWVRRPVIGNGHPYLGLYAYDAAVLNVGVLLRSTGANNTNPYFTVNANYSEWGAVNEWYLMVGHVFPAGSGTGAMHVDSGVYDSNGKKVWDAENDFVWNTTTTQAMHRCYMYYSTAITTQQQMYLPRVDKCDGTEPSIFDLITGKDATINLISNNMEAGKRDAIHTGTGFQTGGSVYASLMYNFNSQMQFDSEQTVELWLTPSNVSSNRQNPYNQAYGGGGTITAEMDGSLNYYFGTSGVNASTYISIPTSAGVHVNGVTIHLCVTRTQTMLTWYVNGKEHATKANTLGKAVTGTFPIYFGSGYTTPYLGEIHAAKVYTRALSASEVYKNFCSLRSRFGL